jgi:hypothetical protein
MNLTILTNNVLADLSDDRFINLTNPLRGTFFNWEIHPTFKL